MSLPIHVAEPVISARCEEERFLPEGPRGIVHQGRLHLAWVNIQTTAEAGHGTIHLWEPCRGERSDFAQPARPGFFVPTTRPGLLLVGREKELGLLDLADNRFSVLATIPDDSPRTIINDGEADPQGEFVIFGTKDVRFAEPLAHLYLFTVADRRLSILRSGQTCSNGKVIRCSPNGRLVYDIDTPTRLVTVNRLDLKQRTLEVLGSFATPDEFGYPDGMCAADDESVLIAFYNPQPAPFGRIGRFRSSDGVLLEEWRLPGSPRVTCPALLSWNGRTHLVATTAVEGMPSAQRSLAPHAGDLFACVIDLPAPLSAEVQL